MNDTGASNVLSYKVKPLYYHASLHGLCAPFVLGLYIVQEIVAAHGGQGTVESVEGQRNQSKRITMKKNTICLWYNHDAEEAARFYARTFPDSTVGAVQRAPSDFPGGKGG